ncbi:TolC family outer membrane protein [Chromatocurvus halotolerans]|uniref:Outer membrane protein n=1 Tax=Chromatocurvus halotolerans TaxID=1132028 RepID=A0A4R2KJ09_9GAMM|nr:TolC family outer membrane protein [Chromatocurvus halotolerans]TCO73214.1 outer membrane protein [Chromatocurvus halotolerans]
MPIRAAIFLFLGLASLTLTARGDSLRDIYETALENDAQLRAEQAQYRATLETEKSALSALLPQISGTYEITNNERIAQQENFSVNQDTGEVGVIDTETTVNTDVKGYTFSLQQAIFDLPAWFIFQSGKEITRQAEATFAANQQNLILRVVEAYLAVLRAQDNLEATKAQERAFERQLEQTQQRFEVGLIAITDVHEAEAAYDLAQVNRIVDENNVDVALERLSVLTGREHNNLDVLDEDFEIKKPEPLDRSAWVEFALANNFNLKAAKYAEEAARQSARASQMAHAPTLRGRASYSDQETTGSLNRVPATPFDAAPDSQVENTSFGLVLEVPLFSGGAVSAERRRAAQEFIGAREERINLSRNTVTNARSLHMTVLSDVARVAARRQSIVSSQSALDATQAGYEVGTRNIVDVLNAQNTLFAAQRDYANSRYDYVLNMLRLKEQAGLLSPEDIYALDSELESPPPPTASSGN